LELLRDIFEVTSAVEKSWNQIDGKIWNFQEKVSPRLFGFPFNGIWLVAVVRKQTGGPAPQALST
jgi:hypothetical protein